MQNKDPSAFCNQKCSIEGMGRVINLVFYLLESSVYACKNFNYIFVIFHISPRGILGVSLIG